MEINEHIHSQSAVLILRDFLAAVSDDADTTLVTEEV
jgi:hypothetical protein